MPDISSSLSKREVNARQNTYTKSEIDLKDGAIQAIAEAAQTTADAAEKKNQEQDQLIAELQKSSHSHSNQDVLDKTEQPYTTAERDKLAGLENYTHPTYTAHAKGFYKFASDGEGHVTDAEAVTKKDITALGIPSENTKYYVSSSRNPDAHGVTLTDSQNKTTVAPLETYRRTLPLNSYSNDVEYVEGRGYLIYTTGFQIKSEYGRFDATHPLNLEGRYTLSSDGIDHEWIVNGDVTANGNTVILNLKTDTSDSDLSLNVYAYGHFEEATDGHEYILYHIWLAVYLSKNLTGLAYSTATLSSIQYTDFEGLYLQSPPDSDHAIDYSKLVKQTESAAGDNTKYELSKTGNTITLTGSDGTSSSVTDSDTTYQLAQYKDLHDNVPNGPIVSLKDSAGAFNDTVVPCTMTYSSWDPVYKEYYGNIPGNNRYASLVDIVYRDSSNGVLPVIIDTYLMVKYGAVQHGCRVKIYHAMDSDLYTYAEVFPPSILSSPKITWTVLTFRVSSDYVFYRVCIDQITMQNIFDSKGSARLLFMTSEDGKLLSQAQSTAEIDANLDENYGTPVPTYTILSSRNASDVAFTGNYNDLSNKPAIPDISGKQDKSTAVTHSANTAVGSATKPVYVAANGVATPISHSINSDVPANAKFTDTTYGDATQSTHGLMTAADKKKLDGMDLSKYLPKSGGVMTGDIDLASNGVDLLVGSQRATQETYATAVAGATISTKQTFSSGLPERKSLVGSFLDQNSVWHSIISVRHRNGYTDGVNYGMYLRSLLTSDSSLIWNKQTGAGKWQGERVLLDSTNYSTYAAKSDHTHDAITNSSLWASGANNAAQWVRLGTVVSSGNFATTVISVWSGDGANGNASQNSWFDIHIKDGWQSTESATKACGVTVYRTRCGTVKVKVIPTAHNTYTVWVYLPWTYWNGNYSVHGKYSSWTPQVLKQAAEPDGTAADIAYYDQAFLTSTVAAANTLTDSGWIATTRDTTFTVTSTVKCRKYGQLVEVRGEVTFSSTYGSPTVCTLPAGYCPATVVQACGITPSGKQYMIKADTSGVISFGSDSGSTFVNGTTYRVDLTYLLG